MRLLYYFIIVITCLATSAYGAIYQYTDSDGVTTYSDQPRKNAKQVILEAPSVSKNAADNNHTDKENADKQQAQPNNTDKKNITYTQFQISTPKDQETFQNQLEIPVVISIEPSLQPNDSIQLFLNNTLIATSKTNRFIIPKMKNGKLFLPRNTYHLHAVLLKDDKKIIMTTEPVTIYVKYGHQNRIR